MLYRLWYYNVYTSLFKVVSVSRHFQQFYSKSFRTYRVLHVEQELLALREYMSSPPAYSRVGVARSLVFCVMLCRSNFHMQSSVIVNHLTFIAIPFKENKLQKIYKNIQNTQRLLASLTLNQSIINTTQRGIASLLEQIFNRHLQMKITPLIFLLYCHNGKCDHVKTRILFNYCPISLWPEHGVRSS
jgi:hypothetical protein